MMTDTTSEASVKELPAFYREPAPLHPERHARLGIRKQGSLAFARETNAIMLTAAEFSMAARNYPIAFAGAQALPFAIVGLRDRQNVFVDAQGQWREGCYVPAYVRRYPFVFSRTADASRLVLCIDEAAESLEGDSEQPLFIDGQPSAELREALRFCEAFQAQHEETFQLGQWLKEHQLLEDKLARAELPDGQVLTLRGFRLIDPEKLRALPDAKVVELHKRGWLALIHYHLQSIANLSLLSALTAQQPRAAA